MSYYSNESRDDGNICAVHDQVFRENNEITKIIRLLVR